MMIFAYKWLLALTVLTPLIWWAFRSQRRRNFIRFSNVRLFGAHAGRSGKSRYLLPVLRTLTVLAVILAVARPQKADEQTKVQTEGIAIQMVLDRSSSMNQQDFQTEQGRPQSRLNAVKNVIREFVLGNDADLKGRPNDLVGLIDFARYPDTECPLTRDHRHLIKAVDEIKCPTTREEDGTAIGDALLLAVERIKNIERKFHKEDEFKVKSRVIILLTDGEQNAGKYTPEKAAEAAAALGIKVYTIGAITGLQEQQVPSFFGDSQVVRVPVNIDDSPLKKVAELTGGKYYKAKDTDSLGRIYQEIDSLERSAIDEQRFYLYHELAYNWIDLGRFKLPSPILVALGLLSLELLLAHTRLRKIP
jgi:Ca-activated chloride channel family protein